MAESKYIRNNGFSSLFFKKSDYIIIGKGMIFYKDLSDNTYPWLNYIKQFQLVKLFYYIFNVLFKCRKVSLGYIIFDLFIPFIIKGIG